MSAEAWIAFGALGFTILVAAVGAVAWLSKALNGLRIENDNKHTLAQHDIDGLRKEFEAKLTALGEAESKARHALAGTMEKATIALRQELIEHIRELRLMQSRNATADAVAEIRQDIRNLDAKVDRLAVGTR